MRVKSYLSGIVAFVYVVLMTLVGMPAAVEAPVVYALTYAELTVIDLVFG